MPESEFKRRLKRILLDAGLYYRINRLRFRRDQRDISQKAFYSKLLSGDDLVFDVGANVGQRAAIFAELAGMVVAFEPQDECVRHLRSRFKSEPKVKIEQLALSDAPGEAVIYESSSHTVSSMSPEFIESVGKKIFKEDTWHRAVNITTDTLDRMISRYGMPQFVKIDVEGFELNVLKGLSQAVPFLSFEFTPIAIDEAKQCVDRLNEISTDYWYDYCLGEELDFVLPEHVDYDTFSRKILPELEHAGSFGDVYAFTK